MEAYQEGNDCHKDRCSFIEHIEPNLDLIVPSLPVKLVLPNDIDTLLEGSLPSHESACQLRLS
jgi:hypothetical protein